MVRIFAPIVVVLVVGIAEGQKPVVQNSIEGRWSISGKQVPTGVKTAITFSKGRFGVLMMGMQRGKMMRIEASGTFQFRGGTLSSTLVDAKIDPAPFSAAERQKLFTPANKASFRKMMVKNGGPEGRVRFLDRDRFELRSKGGTMTIFSRVK